MRLELVATHETFDVPRGLASALILLGKGQIREPLPEAQRPAKAIWSITASAADGLPVLHCHCQNQSCRAHLNAWGPNAPRQKFRHTGGCGAGAEDCPKAIAEEYFAAYRRTTDETPAPRRRPGQIPVL
jgi:hypothetical protein